MLIQSDAFNLPYKSKTFHACVTSPPYYGLRKYSGEQGERPLGLEDTAEEHIERMVVIFREVYRVLRDDGVLWMNYGDAFEDGNLMMLPHRLAIALQADGWIVRNDLVWFKRNPMPESVAGWRFEQPHCACVKGKLNNAKYGERDVVNEGGLARAPSAGQSALEIHRDPDCPKCHGTGKVGDPVLRKSSWRHTRAHEYVFQLVKGMGYYCNQEVVREGISESTQDRWKGHPPRKNTSPQGFDVGPVSGESSMGANSSGRNPRSVLDVPTAPYKGAHYATFPPKLIAPLIRASVPRRCCPECGQAWAPVVEKEVGDQRSNKPDPLRVEVTGGRSMSRNPSDFFAQALSTKRTVTDYRPTCECGVCNVCGGSGQKEGAVSGVIASCPVCAGTGQKKTQHEPGIVLDIFGGSGTTGMVAKQLMRRWVVMDISRPYLDEQAKVRTGSGTPANALDGLPMFDEE